jgi:hypothetical protein
VNQPANNGPNRWVRLHIWGVPTAKIPSAVARMGTNRLSLRTQQHLVFSKLLGTARTTSFTPRDTDPNHWALLTVWDDESAARAFDHGRLTRSWALIADETLRLELTPLASAGQWAGQEPFGRPVPRPHAGPVAAITRARIRPSRMREFWDASTNVARALRTAQGLVLATGIGEAPIGLQGTFSVWSSAAEMSAFAHRRPEHIEVIEQTPVAQWYAEELFSRFAVDRMTGIFAGTRYDLPSKDLPSKDLPVNDPPVNNDEPSAP